MAGQGLSEIPRRAQFELFEGKERSNTIKLHVRRVFTIDDCDELKQTWLNFINGVVNSNDMLLSISRATLPQSKILRAIKKNVGKKCLEMLTEIAKKEEGKEIYEQLACWCETAHRKASPVLWLSAPRMGGPCEPPIFDMLVFAWISITMTRIS